MTLTILSGGQTGVDQAALRAAKACGLPTAGYAPAGWLTEDGPAPWLADCGLIECRFPGYPGRTRANVEAADWVLWIGSPSSPGGKLTLGHARSRQVSTTVVDVERLTPAEVAYLLLPIPPPGRLLVAGNRESSRPGLGAAAEAWLKELFPLLQGDPE